MITILRNLWCRAFHAQHLPRRGHQACECGRLLTMKDSLNYSPKAEIPGPRVFVGETLELGIHRATRWLEDNVK